MDRSTFFHGHRTAPKRVLRISVAVYQRVVNTIDLLQFSQFYPGLLILTREEYSNGLPFLHSIPVTDILLGWKPLVRFIPHSRRSLLLVPAQRR